MILLKLEISGGIQCYGFRGIFVPRGIVFLLACACFIGGIWSPGAWGQHDLGSCKYGDQLDVPRRSRITDDYRKHTFFSKTSTGCVWHQNR